MRTTVRIEDDLLLHLKDEAARERSSLTRVLNRTIRAGLRQQREANRSRPSHREATHAMGMPRVDLTKALALASKLEDDEILRKSELRK
jgi:hypothetical protein